MDSLPPSLEGMKRIGVFRSLHRHPTNSVITFLEVKTKRTPLTFCWLTILRIKLNARTVLIFQTPLHLRNFRLYFIRFISVLVLQGRSWFGISIHSRCIVKGQSSLVQIPICLCMTIRLYCFRNGVSSFCDHSCRWSWGWEAPFEYGDPTTLTWTWKEPVFLSSALDVDLESPEPSNVFQIELCKIDFFSDIPGLFCCFLPTDLNGCFLFLPPSPFS